MTIIDLIIIAVALLIAWFGKVSILLAVLVALVVIILLKLIQGHKA